MEQETTILVGQKSISIDDLFQDHVKMVLRAEFTKGIFGYAQMKGIFAIYPLTFITVPSVIIYTRAVTVTTVVTAATAAIIIALVTILAMDNRADVREDVMLAAMDNQQHVTVIKCVT